MRRHVGWQRKGLPQTIARIRKVHLDSVSIEMLALQGQGLAHSHTGLLIRRLYGGQRCEDGHERMWGDAACQHRQWRALRVRRLDQHDRRLVAGRWTIRRVECRPEL